LRRYASAADPPAGGAAAGETGVTGSLKGAKAVLTGERGINRVTLLGRVGQDSQLRGSADNPVTVFPLATSYTLKTLDGEYVQKTEWHRVSVFKPGLKTFVSQSVKKGDKVYVNGSISYTQYKDKNNVMQRATTIIADDVLNVSRSVPMSSIAVDASKEDYSDTEVVEQKAEQKLGKK